MLTASQAAQASKDSLDSMTAELEDKLQKAINAAIAQGSCKATFYPRNAFESENAVALLFDHGYAAERAPARDQRDNDRIEIQWG